MSLAFSPSQRRCLDAMGYTVYVSAAAQTAIAPIAARQARLPTAAPRRPSEHHEPRPAPSSASAEPNDRRLLIAVLKAARMPLNAVDDPQHWLAGHGIDSIAALREPAAKRALWRRLRTQRRGP